MGLFGLWGLIIAHLAILLLFITFQIILNKVFLSIYVKFQFKIYCHLQLKEYLLLIEIMFINFTLLLLRI
jgi:hypothetical protein